VEKEIRPGERHLYRISARGGRLLEGKVDIENADLSLVLRDSADHVLLRIESVGRNSSPGPLLLVPPTDSELWLSIEPREAQQNPGSRYHLQLSPARVPEPDDRRRAEAVQHLSSGHQAFLNHGFEEASLEYREASGKWLTEEHWEKGTASYWLGLGEYRKGDYSSAQLDFNRAAHELKFSNDTGAAVRALRRESEALMMLNRYPDALTGLGKAADLSAGMGDRAERARALSGKALCFKFLGNFAEALRIDEEALALTEPGKGGVRRTILHNLGQFCLDMARPEDAINWLTQSLEEPIDPWDEDFSRLTLGSLATAYFDLQEAEKALPYIHQALRPPASARYRATALLNLSAILLQLGRSDGRRIPEAMDAAREAGQIAHAEGDVLTESFAASIYGWALEFQKRSEEALRSFAKARPVIEKLGDPNSNAGLMFGIAHAEKTLGHLEEAKRAIERSLAFTEALRAGNSSLEMRSSYQGWSRTRYAFYIDLMMELHRQSPGKGYDVLAFEASERARARAVLDEIAEAQTKLDVPADPRLAKRARELQKEIRRAEEERLDILSRRNDPTALLEDKKLDRKISDLYAALNLTTAAMQRGGEQAAAKPRTLRQIQREVLNGDSVLLSYWMGEEKSYLWRIDRSSIASFELPAQSKIEPLAIELRDSMTRDSLMVGRQKAVKAAAGLSKALLEPVSGRLASSRLLIVADQALQYVPFEALGIAEKTNAKTTRDWPDRPLLLDHEIERVPSASALSLLRRERAGRPHPKYRLAVLAHPIFTATQALPNLPGSEKEARGILALVPPEESFAALGKDASLQTATDPKLGNYQIIHFATHAVLKEHSSSSGLILSQEDDRGQPSLLPAIEIYNLKLPVDLVVLSACQTARGEDKGGEGIGRLTRGFLYSGARSVVVSLWSVSDEATARLMQLFYEGMLRGKLPPSEALRRAQLSIRAEDRWSSPYYWAGFVLQGDGGDPIVTNKLP
jgi:CHAT domain-containing protein